MANKIKISPNHPVGLKLTAEERELLLDLPSMNEKLKDHISQASISEQNVQFTLNQLAELAKAIPAKAKNPWDKKAQKKLERISKRVAGLLLMFEEG